MKSYRETLKNRIDCAQGRKDADLIFRAGRHGGFLDVFRSKWIQGDVAISDGEIVAVGDLSGLKTKREIALNDQYLVPGFIDAHVHVESSMMSPRNFSSSVLRCGTTTAICDPHELANVEGIQGIQYFLDRAKDLPLRLKVMLSSCVPATHLETNGGGTLSSEALKSLAGHPCALGLAEMMNVPGVLHGDEKVLDKLVDFADRPLDGHAPLLRGLGLSAYAACGISSCHESSQLAEAEEKLLNGIAVWIREGSVAKDLSTLMPLIRMETSMNIGYCTDDRNPLDIADEGHVDHLIRRSIAAGVAPELAYRIASHSVAAHYGLDRGRYRIGAIAPGFGADLVLLDDVNKCKIRGVFRAGIDCRELEAETAIEGHHCLNSVRASEPEEADLVGPSGRVRVIGVEAGKIITTHEVHAHDAPGVARLSVLERYGRGSKPSNGYVRGFGESFNGAIASSVGHDSHNLIVVGRHPRDMKVALKALMDCGGGFAVVQGGVVSERVELPIGGLMSEASGAELTGKLRKLKKASQAIGCGLAEPFLQLAFLSLPVIPSLKLTDRGLVDVDKFDFVSVRAS